MTDEGSDSALDALIWQISRKRWRVECEGVVYRGIRWRGDEGGRQSVTETIPAAEAYEAEHGAGSFTTTWKGMDGWLDDATLEDLYAVRALLAERRRACFAHELSLVQAAQAGEAVDLGEGWPE